MKKYVMLLIICMFNSLFGMKSAESSSSDSEDHCLLSNNVLCNEFVKCEDWPFIPFNRMRNGIELLSKKSQQRIYSYKNPLSYEKQFLVSCIGTLPPEIINFIAYKMLDGYKSSVEEVNVFIKEGFSTSQDLSLQALRTFIKVPLIHLFKNYREHENTFSTIPHLKNKSVGVFIGLSQTEQETIINLYKPTLKAKLLFGDAALTEEQWKQVEGLDEATRKEFFEQEEVIVLDKQTDKLWNRCDSQHAQVRAIGLGFLFLGGDLLIAGILKGVGLSNEIAGGVFVGNLVVTGLIFGGFWYCKQRKASLVKQL